MEIISVVPNLLIKIKFEEYEDEHVYCLFLNLLEKNELGQNLTV